MLFSTQDDPRLVAVLVPPSVAKGIEFTKGQTYLIESKLRKED